jgi:hypothetical protein
MAADFVPITPYTTEVLSIGIGMRSLYLLTSGQRYDIVIDADQDISNYWFRAIPQTSCSSNQNQNGIVAIVRYVGASEVDPTTSAYTYTDSCLDESSSNLVPVVVRSPTTFLSGDVLDVAIAPSNGLFFWGINSTDMYLNWYVYTIA